MASDKFSGHVSGQTLTVAGGMEGEQVPPMTLLTDSFELDKSNLLCFQIQPCSFQTLEGVSEGFSWLQEKIQE